MELVNTLADKIQEYNQDHFESVSFGTYIRMMPFLDHIDPAITVSRGFKDKDANYRDAYEIVKVDLNERSASDIISKCAEGIDKLFKNKIRVAYIEGRDIEIFDIQSDQDYQRCVHQWWDQFCYKELNFYPEPTCDFKEEEVSQLPESLRSLAIEQLNMHKNNLRVWNHANKEYAVYKLAKEGNVANRAKFLCEFGKNWLNETFKIGYLQKP